MVLMMNMIRWFRPDNSEHTKQALAMLALAVMAAAASADTVRLKGSVRLEPGVTTVTLADVASLAGEHAESLGRLRIAELEEVGVLELSLAEVRRIMEEGGANWSELHLNGRSVVIRPSREEGIAPPRAMTPMAISEAPNAPDRSSNQPRLSSVNADEIFFERTMRGAIARFVQHGLQAEVSRLRLCFERDDEEILTLQDEDRRYQIQPGSALRSERVELRINIWNGQKIVEERKITVFPQVQSHRVRMKQQVHRGDIVQADDLEEETAWLPPNTADRQMTRENAIGMIADASLRPGSALRATDISSRPVVQRGDRVIVNVISGGVVISFEAEAREEGAVGDTIELRKIGERSTFAGQVAAAGRALVRVNQ